MGRGSRFCREVEVLALKEAPQRKSALDDDSDTNRFFYLSCETGVFRAVKLASLQSWPTIFFSHIYLARVSRLMTKSFGFCASARLATEND